MVIRGDFLKEDCFRVFFFFDDGGVCEGCMYLRVLDLIVSGLLLIYFVWKNFGERDIYGFLICNLKLFFVCDRVDE